VAGPGVIQINAADADGFGVSDGARLKITGPAGAFSGPVQISTQVPPGLLFTPYHCRGLNALQAVAGSNCVAVTAAKG